MPDPENVQGRPDHLPRLGRFWLLHLVAVRDKAGIPLASRQRPLCCRAAGSMSAAPKGKIPYIELQRGRRRRFAASGGLGPVLRSLLEVKLDFFNVMAGFS